MLADALLQKLRHPEMRIAQQGRNAHDRRHHLSIESPAQRHRRYALATGIESVQEQDLLHAQSF